MIEDLNQTYGDDQKSPFNSRAYPPGQHGQNKKGKPTDYGIQLQAKQKLKLITEILMKGSFETYTEKRYQEKEIQLKIL